MQGFGKMLKAFGIDPDMMTKAGEWLKQVSGTLTNHSERLATLETQYTELVNKLAITGHMEHTDASELLAPFDKHPNPLPEQVTAEGAQQETVE